MRIIDRVPEAEELKSGLTDAHGPRYRFNGDFTYTSACGWILTVMDIAEIMIVAREGITETT
jgi:hypothetical protein